MREVQIIFKFSSYQNESAYNIHKLIDLEPYRHWKKGDKIKLVNGTSSSEYKYTTCNYRVFSNYNEIDENLRYFIKIFKQHQEELVSYILENRIEVVLTIVFEQKELYKSFEFNKEEVKFLASINSEIEIT